MRRLGGASAVAGRGEAGGAVPLRHSTPHPPGSTPPATGRRGVPFLKVPHFPRRQVPITFSQNLI